MTIQVEIQATPNPNAIKINTSEVVFEGPASTSLKRGDATDHPLAAALIGIEGIDNIFGIRDFVTVSKTAEANWDDIMPQVQAAFQEVYK